MNFSNHASCALGLRLLGLLFVFFTGVYSQAVFAELTPDPKFPGQLKEKHIPDSEKTLQSWRSHHQKTAEYYHKLSAHYKSIAEEYSKTGNEALAKKYSALADDCNNQFTQHNELFAYYLTCRPGGGGVHCN